MDELKLRDKWLEEAIDDAQIEIAMSPISSAYHKIKLSNRQISKLRDKMRAHFKAVTGREL